MVIVDRESNDNSFTAGELDFENNLIQYLQSVGGTRQWKYRPDIKTTDQLWTNFRSIIEINNQDRLKGTPLTDQEFSQIQAEISDLKKPYDAGQFLYGINGISQVAIVRDDGTEAYLTIFDQDSIGAGNTVYEIVNQIERPAVVPGMKDRRFDTTLLINGLPIIQIEEKAAGHDPHEALNQMRQYIYEQQYSDIFSTLQILIGLTPTDALYMARPADSEHFNTDFSFGWLNEKTNERITDYRDFCNRVLSIPAAHQLATSYMILDGTHNKESIKVMRPYQVFATRAVIEKLRNHRFGLDDNRLGYIWHTTGSGKTITSFKTAWLASRLPNVDKVVFLVDRVALTNQTVEEYQAYDPENTDDSAGGVVTDSANRWQLERKLKSKGKGIIVTSTQKMHAMCVQKDEHNNKQQRDNISTIQQKNIVFIVDEAHRSTDGDMLADIRAALPNSAWVGYTGTPSFDRVAGSRTTQDIFGPMLHAYTIREAIADHNVLGFKVDFETTLSRESLVEDYLPKFFKQRYPDWSEQQISERVHNLTEADMDDTLSPSVYDNNPEHIRLVVKDILEKWDKRSADRRYNALLTTHVASNTSSIGMAIQFYKEFARQNALLPENKRIKVGITYSENQSNDKNQLEQNSFLDTVLADYNAMFSTSFQRISLKEYTTDLAARLNRTISNNKQDWLDLVIVVDRLLTGFDAPQLNTLYVDRTLKGALLIQAYSRTNRIFDMQSKPFGHIVSYRWPGNSEKLMRQALSTYANPDSALQQGELDIQETTCGGVLAESYEEVVGNIQNTINQISDLTNEFTSIPKTLEDAKETLTLINQYSRTLAQAKQDESFPDDPHEFLGEINIDEKTESWMIDTLRRQCIAVIQENNLGIDESMQLNPEFGSQVERVTQILVNYAYLEKLIASMLNALHNNHQEEAENFATQIREQADRMDESNRKYASQIHSFVHDALEGRLGDDTIGYPVEQDDVKKIILGHADSSMRREILSFKQRWGLQDIKDSHLVNEILERHVVGQNDLDINHELTEIQKQAQANYITDATDEEVRKLSRIVYRRKLSEALIKFADIIRKKY